MSHTRRTPDSALATTKPKRRAIDPKEPYNFDWIDELLKHPTTEFLAKEVEKTPELVQRAKEILTEILEILECGDDEEEERVQKFSNLVLGTWPLLTSAIVKALTDLRAGVTSLFLDYANRKSATQRWARMKADPVLESHLAILKPPAAATASGFDILRLFLSILIGYWGDRAELLPKLDKGIGRLAAFKNAKCDPQKLLTSV